MGLIKNVFGIIDKHIARIIVLECKLYETCQLLRRIHETTPFNLADDIQEINKLLGEEWNLLDQNTEAEPCLQEHLKHSTSSSQPKCTEM